MTALPPRLLPSGDAAMTVEFGRSIDPEVNRRVLALDRILAREELHGVTETVPTYRSLLVHYDPVQIGFTELSEKLLALAQRPAPAAAATRRWRVPVVYGGEFGIDLDDVARAHDLTTDEVIARHAGGDYRVAMIGLRRASPISRASIRRSPRRAGKARAPRRRRAPSPSAACRPACNASPRRAAGICSDARRCAPSIRTAIRCS
jgi:hypothetical protein